MLPHWIPLLLFAQGAPADPAAVLDRIRAKADVAPITESAGALAGKYTTSPGELARRVGSLVSGQDLHLFPDGTYVYCEWSESGPGAILDQGAWTVAHSIVELKSGPEIRSAFRPERRYFALRRGKRKDDALLIGIDRARAGFAAASKEDPRLTLLTLGMLRIQQYDEQKGAKAKASLIGRLERPQ